MLEQNKNNTFKMMFYKWLLAFLEVEKLVNKKIYIFFKLQYRVHLEPDCLKVNYNLKIKM